MVGLVMPDCGGEWIPDTGGGGACIPPPDVLSQMEQFEENELSKVVL